jgi:hypothetical protein
MVESLILCGTLLASRVASAPVPSTAYLYAESADVGEAKQAEAARAAGFDGAKAIGPYLRTLISLHHDTLAVAIR